MQEGLRVSGTYLVCRLYNVARFDIGLCKPIEEFRLVLQAELIRMLHKLDCEHLVISFHSHLEGK